MAKLAMTLRDPIRRTTPPLVVVAGVVVAATAGVLVLAAAEGAAEELAAELEAFTATETGRTTDDRWEEPETTAEEAAGATLPETTPDGGVAPVVPVGATRPG